MLANLFEVRETANKGKGIFAKAFIPLGTMVFYEDQSEVVSKKEVDQMSETERETFLIHAYQRRDGSFLMPCDDAKFCNHSCKANILESGLGFDIVVEDIQAGQEATYDYRVFYDEGFEMTCKCGEANCCKKVTCDHPVPPALQEFWNGRISPALKRINEVEQPMKNLPMNHSR